MRQIASVSKDVKQLEPLYTASRNGKSTATVETVWQFLKWLKQNYHTTQQFHTQVNNQKKTYVHIKTWKRTFTAELFIIAKK